MKHIFTISLCFLALSLSAQETITYPYNPDGDADGSITVPDLQDFLGNYGGAFSPSDILVDGETLVTVLTNLQNSIDSLSALTGGSAGSVLDMPIGTILPVASEAVPEDWMLCDGREVEIEDYQAFYDLIGTTYGAGDSAFWAQVNYPATTFNIPDLRGRTIIGADNMGGESAGVVSQHPSWLGQSGGAEMHQLTVEEMASHSHISATFSGVDFTDTFTGLGNGSIAVGENYELGTSEESGGDQSHNNMQPYIALNYMVKVKAAFDVIGDLQSQISDLEYRLDSINLVNNHFYNTYSYSGSLDQNGNISTVIDSLHISEGGLIFIEGMFHAEIERYTCSASVSLSIQDVTINSITGMSNNVGNCNNALSSDVYRSGHILVEDNTTIYIIGSYSCGGYNNYQGQGGNSGSFSISIYR